MKKQIKYITISFICLFLTGCMSQKNSSMQRTYFGDYAEPKNVSVAWNSLYAENPSPEVRKFLSYSQDIKKNIYQRGIPYPAKTLSSNWDRNYLRASDKYNFMRKNGVDCTRFLWHLYAGEMNLPYNSKYKNSAILSHTFAKKQIDQELKNFVPLKKYKNGFQPRTGDILAFPGHALAVLDPKQCIAIQSTSWACEKMTAKGQCHKGTQGKNAGVVIYKLMNKTDCTNGIWNKLDSQKNKFTAGWRHKALNTWIEKIPQKTKTNQTITLIGHNISRRYIFFNGNTNPVKTSYALKVFKSSNGYPLDLVKVTVPKNAISGKIKIYWGNDLKPNITQTVSSKREIIIENNNKLLTNNSVQIK
ncbi:hypothetical protein [Fluviispira multicolorata]|uniref:Uncharacterized protein n=1 Tax=Fluviispira multicolorata TaxID=2654512 RepID=A0A833JA80_9BACT|nr:hypothetical protein [Fluviispira multicolorata]KAB8027396.1 hypothetical protein GCL57_14465 [Fluviispira multicolorata]